MKQPKTVSAWPPSYFRLADWIGIVGLIFVEFYYLTAFQLPTLITSHAREVDYANFYGVPWRILAQGHYPPTSVPFPYPPSAIAMMLPIGLLPQTTGFVIWILLQAACLWISVWSALRLSGAANWPGKWALGFIAVLCIEYPLSWDFRNHSNNVVFLTLVMLGVATRRNWLSALLLAASAGLKIYSSVFVLVFAWRREWRLVASLLLSVLALCTVLPLVVFGPFGFAELMLGWIDEIRFTASLDGYNFGTHIITLRRGFATLLDADPSSTAVIVLWRAAESFWILLVIGYFVLAGRPHRSDGSDIARFADVCIALLAPLPLSTWLEPYHGVIMLPPYVLLLTALFRYEWSSSTRLLAAAALSGPIIANIATRRLEMRGLGFLLCVCLILVGLTAVRRASMQRPSLLVKLA
jgi:hypothetical protein